MKELNPRIKTNLKIGLIIGGIVSIDSGFGGMIAGAIFGSIIGALDDVITNQSIINGRNSKNRRYSDRTYGIISGFGGGVILGFVIAALGFEPGILIGILVGPIVGFRVASEMMQEEQSDIKEEQNEIKEKHDNHDTNETDTTTTNHKTNAITGFIIGAISTFIFADIWIFYDFGEAVAAALIIIGPVFAILGYIISRATKYKNKTMNLLVGVFAGAFIIPFLIGLFGGYMDDEAVGVLFITGIVVGILVAIRNNKLPTQPQPIAHQKPLDTPAQPQVEKTLEPIAMESEAFENATELPAEIDYPITQKYEDKDKDNTKDHSTIQIKSGFVYKGAAIQYKIKVENPTPEPIGDIKVTLFVPDVFLLSESTKTIAMLKPNEAKTVTFDIRPTGECGDCAISGKVVYYDYAAKKTTDMEIPAKSLSVICPLLHSKEISEDAWRTTISRFVKAEEGTQDIDMPASTLFDITSDVLLDMNLYMLEPKITDYTELYRAVARFYGEGVKELRYAAQIEIIGGPKRSKLMLKAWAEREEALIGFYYGMLDEIEKRVNVKGLIDTPAVQQFYHYGDKISTQVKDSVVQRSNIGMGTDADTKNCPGCGREVNDNEQFCMECGEKIT